MEIVDYPNYLIYEDGRIWSKNKNRFITPYICDNGYYRIRLTKNKKIKHIRIHRLIGLHYIPNLNNKECIDHIDGNKLNNKIENLRWVSQTENKNYFKKHQKNCLSEYKNIRLRKDNNKWNFRKIVFGKNYNLQFETKNDALWFKFSLLILNYK
tara:strand:+ start:84 stop:545 length:462 start_codon:yes stop_codon:yes gene_type:complete